MSTIPDPSRPDRWARLRFSIIGHLLAAPTEPGTLRQAPAELAAREWRPRLPIGRSALAPPPSNAGITAPGVTPIRCRKGRLFLPMKECQDLGIPRWNEFPADYKGQVVIAFAVDVEQVSILGVF